MKGLISYGKAEQSSLVGSYWALDSEASTSAEATNNIGFATRHRMIVKQPDPKGTFSFVIPASHMLGFFEDYDKLIYGVKQTLTLMRTANTDAIFKAAAVADNGKIELTQVSWQMPHVVPSDEQKIKLYDMIDRGISVDLGFRHWHLDSCELPQTNSFTWRLITTSAIEKPRWIVIGFQTGRQNNLQKKSGRFRSLRFSRLSRHSEFGKVSLPGYQYGFYQKRFRDSIQDV